MIDRGAAIVIPARPDLNWSPTTQDRVWNTMVKFDQQISSNHTWGVRWLRELSPQRNQVDRAAGRRRDLQVASGGIREEDDKDQTAGRDVLVRPRQQQAELAPRGLDAGRRGLRQPVLQRQRAQPARRASRTLNFQTFTDQQSSVAQARVNDALPDRRHVHLVPAQQARRPRHQVRDTVRARDGRQLRAGQPERHLLVRHEQRAVQSGRSADLSGSPVDSSARPGVRGPEGALRVVLRPGQVEDDATG